MIRFIVMILLSTLSGFSSEFSDLKKSSPRSVLERDLRAPFLSSPQVEEIGLGKVWHLRTPRDDDQDKATADSFAKVVARHAYQTTDSLNYTSFEEMEKSAQDILYKVHFLCIQGIVLTAHLLKDPIYYSADDARILSKVKRIFKQKGRQELLERSYSSLETSEKGKKAVIFDNLQDMLDQQEFTREECLSHLGEDSGLSAMPVEQLRIFRSISSKSKMFMGNKITRQFVLGNIFKIIEEASESETTHLLRSIDLLLKPIKDLDTDTMGNDMFLGGINDISGASNRKDFVKQTLRYVLEGLALTDLYNSSFMIYLAKTQEADRPDIVTQTLRMMAAGVSLTDLYHSGMASDLGKLSTSKRSEVASSVVKLITAGMSLNDIRDKLKL